MNETNQKIMVIGQREAAKRVLAEMLSPLWDVTFVDSGGEAHKKAKDEEYDLIVTDCILPRLAGKEGVLTFKTGDAKVPDEKAALHEKVKDTVHRFETDFKSKVSESEALLAQSQIQQEKISELIHERLRRLEEEKIQHSREIEGMEHEKQTALDAAAEAVRLLETVQKESEIALSAKGEAEKQLEAALIDKENAAARLAAAIEERAEAEQRLAALVQSSKAEIDALNMTINSLKEDLEKSAAAVEAMIAEKATVEQKLERIQEQWEKFAGNQ